MEAQSSKAVFLSYASQDADAARRIAETLRACGVEVWFDQSELRGGDAWDQKIRQQIHECALFLPVISATTQTRLEGYFRIEWKLAAQRTYAMADARPFLLPVVIDATRDAEAHVPIEFKTVQWTRLPHGETTAEFAQRVQALLASGLVAGVPDPLGRRLAFAEEKPGDWIGRYKLREKIGEGGCGSVWRAEQQQPVHRSVALKVIKLGMDTKEVIGRFEAERQALALMDHPHIATVYDAGTTDTGRPFFVMELVRGVPITRFCDEHKLSTTARLDLFVQVCHAIQHAHQKGIIHRDLKPSNILVALQDDAPVAKVIDFGIAKATTGRLTDQTVFTAVEQFIGTPAYMSPEQAEMGGLDVDTRSDIYSLGVLLYELLTGGTPFDRSELVKIGWDEMRRTIREKEPPRPSSRLSKMHAEGAAELAQRRGVDVPRLIALVRGDLDWIVMKCLEKDRTRRYETANGLALDLQRHLQHEPVAARPPSVAYKAAKFVRRNRIAVAAASAVMVALIAGIVVSTWQMVRAKRAEIEQSVQRLAAEKARVEAEAARTNAEAQRHRAEAGEQSARLHLYAADMCVAQQALEQGNLNLTRELTDKYRPAESGVSIPSAQPFRDLRGWEWRHLWLRSRSQELYTLGAHQSIVDFVGVSEDGALLATSSWDCSVRIWDMVARRELAAIRFPTKPDDLCFVPRSQTVAVANGNRVSFLSASGVQEADAIVCEGPVRSVAYSRDGRRLAICETEELRLLDVRTRRELWRAPVSAGWRAVFSPDGALLAVASNKKEVCLLNAATGQLLDSLAGYGRSYLGSLVFSPDGAFLACAAAESEPKVLVYEVKTRRLCRELQPEGPWFGGLAFSPDGQTMAVAGGSYEIILYQVGTWQVIRRLQGHLNEAWPVVFSPDGRYLASGSKDATVRIWDPNALKPPGTGYVRVAGEREAVRLSPDGSKLCVLKPSGSFVVWDLTTLRPLAEGPFPFEEVFRSAAGDVIERFALSSDGRRMVMVTPSGQVRVWHTETCETLAVLDVGLPHARTIALSPDGRIVAIGYGDGSVGLWDLLTKTQLRSPPPEASQVWSLVFSPDSRFVAVGFDNGQVVAWSIADSRKLRFPHVHNLRVVALSISQDSRFLAAASIDARVTLWNLEDCALIKAFTGALNSFNCVTFSADGRRVLASGRPAALSVWDCESLQSVGTFKVDREISDTIMGAIATDPVSDTVVTVGNDVRGAVLHFWRAHSLSEIAATDGNERKGNRAP